MKKQIFVDEKSGIPLVGCIMFGIIDRGTNLLQIRPNTACNLNCIFCSTDSGVNSIYHKTDYVVEVDYLLKWVKEIVEFKGKGVEANIDSVGEPMIYYKIFELIKGLKKIDGINFVSMQTNGTLIDSNALKKLEEVGLDRINLSLHSLDNDKAKNLSGCKEYNVNKVKKLAEQIAKSKIELIIAPVLIPKINDKDIEDLIEFSKKLNCKIGIQKYEIYRYSRKVKGVKAVNYWKFYKKLGELEKKYNVRLKMGPSDFDIEKRKRLPKVLSKGDKIVVDIKADGWLEGQKLGVFKDRCISVNNCKEELKRAKIRILEDKNNIYIGELL